MTIGLVIALGVRAIADRSFSRNASNWSWLLAAVGGVTVGGALALFVYGVLTDRSDTGVKRRGCADVTPRPGSPEQASS